METKSDFSDSAHLSELTPMGAATLLYSEEGCAEVARAIVNRLSTIVFDTPAPAAASGVKRILARLACQCARRTTRVENGNYRNHFLERSQYPYAQAMLHTSDESSAALVEGGDPMNAPYMMGIPEIRANGVIWDTLFLDSVIAKDVRLRFLWETAATYELAKARLEAGKPVRMKAAAAGTGLSMIVAYDRLIRDDYAPEKITVVITDRAAENSEKTNRLIKRLGFGEKISAHPEDLLASIPTSEPFDVYTLIGILEYFTGTTLTTTEELEGSPAPSNGSENAAAGLLNTAASMLAPGGTLIANTFRLEPGGRILEAFGKRFRYRTPDELRSLATSAGLTSSGSRGSAHIFDVELFQKPLN